MLQFLRVASAWLGLTMCLSGCLSYALHDRAPRAEFKLPIDEDKPITTVKWSTVWGGSIPVWKPVRCWHADGSTHYLNDAESDPQCTHYERVCEQGVGRSEVALLGYSLPIALLTLGFAMPAELTVYCSTASAPSGPLGPE